MLYLGFGQINVLIVPVYLIQKALVLQFKSVKQLVDRLIYFKPLPPLLAGRGCVLLFFGWFPSIVFSSVSI